MTALSPSGCCKLCLIIVFLIGNEFQAKGAPWLPRMAESSSPTSLVNISIVDMTVYIQHRLLLKRRNERCQIENRNKGGIGLVPMKDELGWSWTGPILDPLISVGESVWETLRIRRRLPLTHILTSYAGVRPKFLSVTITKSL